MTDLLFHGFFEDSTNKDGEPNLTVTVDVYRVPKGSASAGTKVATDQNATETVGANQGGGHYHYLHTDDGGGTDPDLTLYDYKSTFKTTSADVVSKHIAGLRWDAAEAYAIELAHLDADVSSRSDGTGVTLADGAITAAKIAANAIAAAKIAVDAIGADQLAASAVSEIQSGLSTLVQSDILSDATPFPGASINATIGSRAPSSTALDKTTWTDARAAKLDYLDTAISSIATDIAAIPTAAEVWSYVKRTITMSPAQINSLFVAGEKIQVYNNSEINIDVTDLGSLANVTRIWVTVKYQPSYASDADSESLFQIVYDSVGSNDGLLYILGAEATGLDTKGSVTIDDATTGAISIVLDYSQGARLPAGDYQYDIKCKRSAGVLMQVLATGKFVINSSVTKATS